MEGMEKTIAEKINDLYKFCNSVRCDCSCPLYFKCFKQCTNEAFEHMSPEELNLCWKTIAANNQEAKADSDKLPLDLVPPQIIRDIAEVRRYGNEKYGDPNNWRKVELRRYLAALMRHTALYLDYLNGDEDAFDSESGIEHYKHMACNMAFICQMEKWRKETPDDSDK